MLLYWLAAAKAGQVSCEKGVAHPLPQGTLKVAAAIPFDGHPRTLALNPSFPSRCSSLLLANAKEGPSPVGGLAGRRIPASCEGTTLGNSSYIRGEGRGRKAHTDCR